MSQKTIKERLLDEFERPSSDEPFDSYKIATKLFYPENLNLVFAQCTDNDTHDDLLFDGTIRLSRQEAMDIETNGNGNGNETGESEAMDLS